MPPPRTHGFTLLELLVATAITLVIVLIATTVLFQMIKTTRHINATMSMHAAAQGVQEQLARETAAMHPCGAVWLVSDPNLRTVELIFLRGKEHVYDFSVNQEIGRAVTATKLGYTDLVWTRWHWTESEGVLSVSQSRSARQFLLDNGNGTGSRNFWQMTNNMDIDATTPSRSTFICVPQPRRDTQPLDDPTTTSVDESLPLNRPVDVLNQNRWKTGDPTDAVYLRADLGDYDDLLRNAKPVLHGCSKMRIDVVDGLGAVQTADGLSALNWAAAGCFVDGGMASGGSSRGFTPSTRPGLIRLRFTLNDPRSDASFEYSFSCRTPHPAPY